MTIAENIRTLADQDLDVADIARRLGIRYQHAYGVLKRSGALPQRHSVETRRVKTADSVKIRTKPSLFVDRLIRSDFAFAGHWILTDGGELALDRPVSRTVGVYAFAIDRVVVYVGVATNGIARRLRFYAKPGSTQRTSLRLNQLMRSELATRPCLDIYIAMPNDLEWNELPVHGSAGLELGLIRAYALPWNIRSAG